MELRSYWDVIRRRWQWPLLLALLVALFSLATQRPWIAQPPAYQASMRFSVGIKPERIPGVYTYDRYYTWLASEYLVDDLGEVVRSRAFTDAVAARLAGRGIQVSPQSIGAQTQPGKLHRILTVSVNGGNPDQVAAIAEAIVATLTQQSAEFFGQFSAEEADIRLIDPPSVGAVPRPAREQFELPLRIILGLAAGLGLAFLLDYLDTSVRDRKEVEEMGMPVLGEIPRKF